MCQWPYLLNPKSGYVVWPRQQNVWNNSQFIFPRNSGQSHCLFDTKLSVSQNSIVLSLTKFAKFTTNGQTWLSHTTLSSPFIAGLTRAAYHSKALHLPPSLPLATTPHQSLPPLPFAEPAGQSRSTIKSGQKWLLAQTVHESGDSTEPLLSQTQSTHGDGGKPRIWKWPTWQIKENFRHYHEHYKSWVSGSTYQLFAE